MDKEAEDKVRAYRRGVMAGVKLAERNIYEPSNWGEVNIEKWIEELRRWAELTPHTIEPDPPRAPRRHTGRPGT